jgi:hypothetical protein
VYNDARKEIPGRAARRPGEDCAAHQMACFGDAVAHCLQRRAQAAARGAVHQVVAGWAAALTGSGLDRGQIG